jgi:two-component system sensor histidine kinase/response regulator
MRILVVDDNESSREILQGLLESMSFEVSVAVSGEDGINELERVLKDKPYKLVIMDWKMPGMDGIAVSRKIRNATSGIKNTKIIMLTAYGREEIMRQAEQAGLDGFLIKPVTQSMLFDTIMQAFGADVEREHEADVSNSTGEEALERIRGARVLIAEDNEINQEVVREILEQAGLVVDIANEGKEAVEMIRHKGTEAQGHGGDEYPFDVVLMDIQMPVMDGFTATAEIRKDERFKDLPIVAMTAHAMAGDREKSIAAGMNDHVTKPIDPNELFSALLKWIDPPERDFQPENKEDLKKIVGEAEEMESEEEILPSQLPGISIISGISKVGENEKLYRKLLGKFLESNKDVVSEIRKNLEDGDMETAARLAHTVKGVSGNLGAERLFSVAAELEKSIMQGEMESLESLVENFESHLNVVMDGIQALEEKEASKRKKEAISAETAVEMNTVKPIIVEMVSLLETDITEAMNLLEDLRGYLENSPLWEEFIKLEKHVEGFDTDSALITLETILRTFD